MGTASGRPARAPEGKWREQAGDNIADLESLLNFLIEGVSLTPTLRHRLVEVASGMGNSEIAETNSVSINTVRSEVRCLLTCIGLRCRHQLQLLSDQLRFAKGSKSDADRFLAFIRDYLLQQSGHL